MAIAQSEVATDPAPPDPELFPSRFDWLMSWMAVLVIAGFYLDLWAHSHDRVDDSFLTPWHAVMYAGVAGFGVALMRKAGPARTGGAPWRAALPPGYGLSLVGVALFLIGGGFDFVWHTVFGIEQSVDALFSPSHLVLAGAGLLMLAGPMRRAWRVGAAPGFPSWVPWVLSAMATMSILTSFTEYAHPATETWPAGFEGEGFQRSDLVIMSVDGALQTRLSIDLADGLVTPAVSPDGSQIAFAAQTIDEGQVHGSLYLMNIDGSGVRLLHDEPGGAGIYRPDWSPDGNQIIYNADVDANVDLYLIDVAGGEPTRLTTADGLDFAAVWSPDGERVVFTSQAGEDLDLYTMSRGEWVPRLLLARAGDDNSPSWSPDGTRIVFSADGDIYTINADGTGLVQTTTDPLAEREPRFSPDGGAILFVGDREGQFDVFSMAPDGSGVTNVSRHPGGDEGWGGIAWLPDGSGFVTNESGLVPGWSDQFFREALGAASLWIQAAILAAFVSLLVMTVGIPPGAITLLLVANALAMSVLQDSYWFVAAVAAGALVIEVVLSRLRRSPGQARPVRIVAAFVPGVWYASYLVGLAVQPDGLGWTLPMVAGAPFVAAGIGYLVAAIGTIRPYQPATV